MRGFSLCIFVFFCVLIPGLGHGVECEREAVDRVRGMMLSPHASDMTTLSDADVPALRCLASTSESVTIVRRRARLALGNGADTRECALLLRPYFSRDPIWTKMESLDAMSYLPLCFGISGEHLLMRELLWGTGPMAREALRVLVAARAK